MIIVPVYNVVQHQAIYNRNAWELERDDLKGFARFAAYREQDAEWEKLCIRNYRLPKRTFMLVVNSIVILYNTN